MILPLEETLMKPKIWRMYCLTWALNLALIQVKGVFLPFVLEAETSMEVCRLLTLRSEIVA